MSKIDTMVIYLARIIMLRGQFIAIRIMVENKELVPISLNGLVLLGGLLFTVYVIFV